MFCVSVIICTRNRADSLRETLASIGRCDVPADMPAELLVVDNGSADYTREVAEHAGLMNMRLRYIHEPRTGQCYARNRGLAEGLGEVFLFTDDDVRVPANWIAGMCRRIVDGEADAVAGGVTFPAAHERKLAVEPFRSRRVWFAATDGISPGSPERMVGANMAFARRVLQTVAEFDLRLGPGALGFCDETLFSWRLMDAGHRLAAALDIAVEHHFDLSRFSRKYLLSHARRMGASQGYVAWHWDHVERPSAKVRRDAKRDLLVSRLRRLRRPWRFFSKAVDDWELCQVEKVAYYEQLWRESTQPRRYARQRQPAGVINAA